MALRGITFSSIRTDSKPLLKKITPPERVQVTQTLHW